MDVIIRILPNMDEVLHNESIRRVHHLRKCMGCSSPVISFKLPELIILLSHHIGLLLGVRLHRFMTVLI